jgi:hypothetical protein
MARPAASHDAERNERIAPELGGDCLTIGSGGYLGWFSA